MGRIIPTGDLLVNPFRVDANPGLLERTGAALRMLPAANVQAGTERKIGVVEL